MRRRSPGWNGTDHRPDPRSSQELPSSFDVSWKTAKPACGAMMARCLEIATADLPSAGVDIASTSSSAINDLLANAILKQSDQKPGQSDG